MPDASDSPRFDPVEAVGELAAFERVAHALASTTEADPVRLRANGLWGASSGLLIAALVRHTSRPVLAVTPTPEEADRLESDIATFLSGALSPAVKDVLPLPAYDVLPTETDTPEMPVLSARLTTLRRLHESERDSPTVAVAPVAAVLQPVPKPEALREGELVLRVNQEIGFDHLREWLFDRGLERVPEVQGRGEFAVRGGIVDIFPLYSDSMFTEEGAERPHDLPVRVEFFGDRVDSLRTFDPVTQRSISETREFHVPGIERARALDPYTFGRPGSVTDYLPHDALLVVAEPDEVERMASLYSASELSLRGGEPGTRTWKALVGSLEGGHLLETSRMPGSEGGNEIEFDVGSVQRLAGRAVQTTSSTRPGRGEDLAARLTEFGSRLAALTVYCRDATEEARLTEILKKTRFDFPEYFTVRRGLISAGFEVRDLKWAALADHELLGVTSEHRRVRARPRGEPISDFIQLAGGDYVVHATHGIARYLGMTRLEKPGGAEDYLTLLFAENARLYVPAGHAYLVEKYVGAREEKPALSKIGGRAWRSRKARAEKAVRDIAADLLKTQAARARAEGIAYPPDSEFQLEFEAAFPYEETADQLAAAEAIKRDMERPVPLDRLLCGDVGFGKTEVALRAAFKATMAGRQVAVLVPTTLLADQHGKTFTERLAEYPVRVEVLSRFKTRAQQRAVLADLAAGQVDIVIGTQRLLSKDVEFRDLGLIVIDEEQRFGVEHKEKLKRLRLSADVLTLTATPIPRTLHMALVGLRDISNLAIPPEDRLSIRTKVCRYDTGLIRRAVLRELARGGQVYFVHDRVMDIDAMVSRLRAIVPEARITVGHGQMRERELAGNMRAFLARETDILVSTTIIENGIDIPTVNTIFINNADRFGLAELHQLRGRVGRYRHQAYAYLLLPGDRAITTDAERRLRAIEEFRELGAGFKLAMRDLEIRGAGNLLGAEQSGHIAEVGYELYCRLLERAVSELKGERVREPLDVTVSLGWGASLPPDYIPDEAPRLDIYRKLGSARDSAGVDAVRDEMRDRFGQLPEPAERVLAEGRIRLWAQAAEIPYVARELEGPRGRLDFKMRKPEFKELERKLRDLKGDFAPLGPEGFALHLSARELREDVLEERIVCVLRRLAE